MKDKQENSEKPPAGGFPFDADVSVPDAGERLVDAICIKLKKENILAYDCNIIIKLRSMSASEINKTIYGR